MEFLTQRNVPTVPEPTRTLELVKKEGNLTKLNVLATLLLYADLLRSQRPLKSESSRNEQRIFQ